MSIRNSPGGYVRVEFDCPIFGEESRVAKRLVDVAGFDVRIGLKDGFTRFAGRHQPKQTRYGKPQPANTGLARTDLRIDGNTPKDHMPKIACDAEPPVHYSAAGDTIAGGT